MGSIISTPTKDSGNISRASLNPAGSLYRTVSQNISTPATSSQQIFTERVSSPFAASIVSPSSTSRHNHPYLLMNSSYNKHSEEDQTEDMPSPPSGYYLRHGRDSADRFDDYPLPDVNNGRAVSTLSGGRRVLSITSSKESFSEESEINILSSSAEPNIEASNKDSDTTMPTHIVGELATYYNSNFNKNPPDNRKRSSQAREGGAEKRRKSAGTGLGQGSMNSPVDVGSHRSLPIVIHDDDSLGQKARQFVENDKADITHRVHYLHPVEAEKFPRHAFTILVGNDPLFVTLDSPITHPEPGMLVYMVVGETEVNGVILKGVVIYSQESGGPVGWMRFEEADLAKDALLKGKMVTGVIQGPVSDELWGTRSRKGPTFCNKASVFWEEWD